MLIMLIRKKKIVAYFLENVEIGPGMNLFNWDKKTVIIVFSWKMTSFLSQKCQIWSKQLESEGVEPLYKGVLKV